MNEGSQSQPGPRRPSRRSWPGPPDPRLLRRAAYLLLALGLLAFLLKGANQPPDPHLRRTRPQPVEGFGQIAFRVDRTAAGERCALLAQTEAQRGLGLMGRTDLAGHDGMLFVFEADARNPFFMQNTPLPLSIAWFDAEGRFVSAADMEPCLNRTDCPLYSATGPYRYALEVPLGGLAELGIGPGSVISVGGTCR